MLNPKNGETVTFRIKRGLRTHRLIVATRAGVDQEISSGSSVARLLVRLVARVTEMRARGFVEI